MNNRVLDSYQEVCKVLGLVDNNCEWKRVLDAAFASLNGEKSRGFFALVLLFCEIPNPIELFEAFKETFIEDIRRQSEITDGDLLRAMALKRIGTELESHGRCLRDYGLPEIDLETIQVLDTVMDRHAEREPLVIREERNYDEMALKSLLEKCLSRNSQGALTPL